MQALPEILMTKPDTNGDVPDHRDPDIERHQALLHLAHNSVAADGL